MEQPSTPSPYPRVTPLGDAAVLVQSPLSRRLLPELERRPPPGLREVVPALHALTVLFDPLHTDAERLSADLHLRLAALAETEGAAEGEKAQTAGLAAGRSLVLPVTFDGPDLSWCAAHTGLSEAAFIRALCSAPLEVAFLGFTPGFAFLTGLPPALQMPRLATPRERVPAGSVALGGPWAGVYPQDTPGGWRIVGSTRQPLFDLTQPDPVWWRPGDRVQWQDSGPHD